MSAEHWPIQEKTIRDAFESVAKLFPISGYMQPYMYIEVSVICHALARHLGSFSGKRLFDVGSGPMDKTAVFARLGFDAYAADDLSDPWHQLPGIRQRILDFANDTGIKFHLQAGANYDTPFEKGTFDVVTSLAVIEHLHDSPRHIMNYMGECLRPGGILVVVMPNAVNLRKRLSVLFGRTNYVPLEQLYYCVGTYRGHVREYTLAETKQLCEISGFQVLESRTFEHHAHQKLPRGLRELYLSLGRLIPGFRSGLLVVAQKPKTWQPVPEDTARYFSAISGALPTPIDADTHLRPNLSVGFSSYKVAGKITPETSAANLLSVAQRRGPRCENRQRHGGCQRSLPL